MNQDPEIKALSEVHEALKGLNKAQLLRILSWTTDKFGLSGEKGEPGAEPTPAARHQEPPAVEILPPAEEPVKKRRGRIPRSETSEEPVKARRGRRPGSEKPGKPVIKRRGRQPRTLEATPAPSALPSEPSIFDNFATLEDLFFKSEAKTLAAKVLLTAAYLQKKHNLKEITSFDINSRLKKIKEGIQNINIPMNTLLTKEPPLLIQTGTIGNSIKAKRKFTVTEEGLRIARNYIIE